MIPLNRKKEQASPKPKKKAPDTPKRKQKRYFKAFRFVDEYMVDLNPIAAWRRCGWGTKNDNKDRSLANEALNRPKIKRLLQKQMDERAKRTEITQERVLKELALMAFYNIKDIATWDGKRFVLKPFDQLTREQTAVIASAEPMSNGLVKFRIYDKRQALVDVGRHLGMFLDGSGVGTGEDVTEFAKKAQAALREMEAAMGGRPSWANEYEA